MPFGKRQMGFDLDLSFLIWIWPYSYFFLAMLHEAAFPISAVDQSSFFRGTLGLLVAFLTGPILPDHWVFGESIF